MSRQLLTLALIAGSLGLGACQDHSSPTEPEAGTEGRPRLDPVSSGGMSGWLHALRGDPRRGEGTPRLRHQLIDDQGRATELVLDEALLARLGGAPALSGKRVRIEGQAGGEGRVRVSSLSVETLAGVAAGEPLSAPKIGSHPYVTIGCKFADAAVEPRTIATYTAWTTGTTYPGLDHYWRELSYNQMNVAGSVVVGWYTLPHPQSRYVTPTGLDFQALATDCTGAADPQVNFPQYYGINLQFNTGLDCCSWGGSWTLTADGQTRTYGMTWMADWADATVYAHEEGHSLGLPHSSGPYDATYDSQWDVMSSGYVYWDPAKNTHVPQHTIGYHKDLLGWIPGGRKLTVGANTSHTITLERLAQPGSGNYLLAEIPLDAAPGQFYTVETRRLVGSYDAHVPGNAVVIHRVDPGIWSLPARVVDPDNNGDPNDAGAQWTVGETFTDPANGISVAVTAETATGFKVTITRGVAGNVWASRASLAGARSAFALATSGGLLYAIGGRNNGATVTSVEAYNPTTDAWTGKAALPAARYDGNGAAAIGGLLYLPGGRSSNGALTRTLYAYSMSKNAWSTKAVLPISSGCGASVNISGLLYVFTGCDGGSGFKGLLHRYAPSSNAWSARASAPAAHGYPAVGVINGKLYVAGGRNAAGSATAMLHVYDPGSNSWSTKAAMPSARYGATGRVIGGKLYVVGGTTASGSTLAATLVYDPATNLWATKAAMPTARTSLASGVVNSRLYAVGGRAGSSDVGTVERYTP